MVGIAQINSVQINMRTGKAINVFVSPKRLMIMLVPNSENRKDIVFVV
jgi:hypothetical protein